MRVPRLFHPAELTPDATVNLSDDAFQHSVKALRMTAGQAICLFNGDGFDYPATLTSVDKRSANAQIDKRVANHSESNVAIHLGQVISRGDRMDFALQKSVELGVSAITPLFSERCGVKLSGERLEKKRQQWQKIVISACEQSGRSYVPQINEPRSVEQFVDGVDAVLKLTLDPHAKVPLSGLVAGQALSSAALLIGPEGGFTEAEISRAEQNDFKPIRVGPRILRTETAALTALSVIQYEFGDLA